MASPDFDVEQSIFDSFAPDSIKYGLNDKQNEQINQVDLSSYYQAGPNGLATLSEFPSLYTSHDSLTLNDTNSRLAPYLDEETPGSSNSASLSPYSPASGSTNAANVHIAFGTEQLLPGKQQLSPDSDNIGSLIAPIHEKRKASIAPVDDTTKNAKIPKAAPAKKPGKPGRKADAEPVSKRKAQNRAAQRAFRERKERHLKELEDRVSELESESHTANTENSFLKEQVARLQGELQKYRTSKNTNYSVSTSSNSSNQFTFEFPFYRGKENKKPSLASINSQESSPGLASKPHSAFGSVSSVSSSQSSIFDRPREESFCDKLSDACGDCNNPIPRDTSLVKDNDTLVISSNRPLATPPMEKETTVNSLNKSSNTNGGLDLLSPPVFELDFLSDYRDPIFDSEDFQLPDLTTENSVFDPLEPLYPTDTSTYDILPVPSAPLAKTTHIKIEEQELETVPANTNKSFISCTAIWDRISAHPKFGELDIDGLCSELRTKAKCSDNGVVMSERDVTKILSNINN